MSAPDYLREAALRRAAHLAFIASESFFLPAAVSPPFFFAGALAGVVPFRRAQRLRAAAASLARVAADIGLRPRERLLAAGALAAALEPPPEKSEANRRSSVLICCLSETASVNFVRDKSMGS